MKVIFTLFHFFHLHYMVWQLNKKVLDTLDISPDLIIDYILHLHKFWDGAYLCAMDIESTL